MIPDIKELSVKTEIQNYITREVGILEPLDDDCDVTAKDIQQIATICNSPTVFDMLFADLSAFKGRRYGPEDADFFVSKKSRAEWRDVKAFVYVARNSNGQIVCAVDIKSPEIQDAEIGYWADPDNPGWMTNSVIALTRIAKKAGFKRLFGLVRLGNVRSEKVLSNAGFTLVGEVMTNDIQYNRYEMLL
ncbi:GNAT family N-acetyltransferase [Candidatus Nomurabacteria bacterium]|uniref:GNAT family N-acetyltransferase n=2 Tax=Bacteria candidate phyla TaxID=1783234 RepID=A0A955LXG8_UNCKA|nr:GNAT family N-acetyltransferase [Candidatus Dojkabacteria bacterium]MCA9398001.1 GNAT family N-acetyltransferase [candidate division WWE3 bacterium]MCB9789882.1 GNAT family N-acetyltransferase [Candidatus Nomurabacteria bacterium]MCB9803494.1 GNAT family N-acetyltransferase [Candidatus Nomurabacteria bacterium]